MRTAARITAWALAIMVLGIAAWFGINATDETLSADAQAAMRTAPPPQPDRQNGFIDFLALGATADAPTFETGVAQLAILNRQADGATLSISIDQRIPRCKRGEFLTCVTATPDLRALIDAHATLLARYREMRNKPRFIELLTPGSPLMPLPSYLALVNGNRLVLMRAALDFNAGRRAAALAEVEAELAFYRKVASDSDTLMPKLISWAMADATAIFAAEVARKMPREERPLWARLQAAVRTPVAAELRLVPAVRRERALYTEWMRTRKYARLPDEMYEMFQALGDGRQRPWWDPIAPYLYRPHQSVNKYVAQGMVMDAIADVPAPEFRDAQIALRARAAALEPAKWQRLLLNPVGHTHYWLSTYDFSDMIGRAHTHAAVHTLVALQIRLRAAGIVRPDDVAKALAGPLGLAHANPFTGKPMDFDAQKMTIGFPTQLEFLTGPVRETLLVSGRVALPL